MGDNNSVNRGEWVPRAGEPGNPGVSTLSTVCTYINGTYLAIIPRVLCKTIYRQVKRAQPEAGSARRDW